MASLPIWEHGLKPGYLVVVKERVWVAPYMGAWIETIRDSLFSIQSSVAPYMGAWIETRRQCIPVRCNFRRSLYGSVD